MRKLTIPAITLIVMSMFSFTAVAADVTISVIGSLMSASCSVSTESRKQTVEMGTWAVKQFSSTSAGTLAPVPFTISLENCGEAVSSTTITFSGQADGYNAELLKLSNDSTASHVAIALLDKNRTRIPLEQPSEPYEITGGADKVSLQFYAQYVASGGEVTAGSANADATFTLTYQ